MPPKRDKKGKEEDQGKSDAKGNEKPKKKVLTKGDGMGGTIGLIEKPIKKCLTTVKTVTCPPPPSCPPRSTCCMPMICCQTQCYPLPPNCCKPC